MKLVEDIRTKGVFNKKEYYFRLKSDVGKLCNTLKIKESTEQFNELNMKVRAVRRNFR